MASTDPCMEALIVYQHQASWAQHRLNLVVEAWRNCANKSDEACVAVTSETMSLQLRMALECIAFAALATNKRAYLESRPKGLSDWNAKRIVNAIDELNPNFFPWQFVINLGAEGGHLTPSFVTHFDRTKFLEAYETASDVLHAPNPFQPKRDYFSHAAKLEKWAVSATKFWAAHVVELPGHGFILANVDSKAAKCRVRLLQAKDGGAYVKAESYPGAWL